MKRTPVPYREVLAIEWVIRKEMTRQLPNQMTRLFGQMKKTCPQMMHAYAQCVILHQCDGTLEQKSCQAEFEQVKQCLKTIRLKKR